MFYVFSILNMLLYIGLAALVIENTNKGVKALENLNWFDLSIAEKLDHVMTAY